ncbi:porin family protein [Sinomicrobium soli]|uniref:porin family protein n=1 Tax=Sinomicrobium sp. N-1-3-6 TaxID=2219864 RepID=UPI000DCE68E1|nr:porin family protein [Sinomicrobium sp. N-1-3-6]RAV27986.1 PorT family protein [Sinomicrobium sp. N-1-3-6]
MKIQLLLISFCCFTGSLGVQAQEKEDVRLSLSDTSRVDDKYREDQVYVGITYNILLNRPADVKQQNLSRGVQVGIIKDMPLNAARNVALGIGLGYGFNSYFHNLQMVRNEGGMEYGLIPEGTDYKRNKMDTHVLEVPIEFRWRTSTARSYKFWRVYAGVRLGYVFSNRYKFLGDETVRFSNSDIRKFQSGLQLSAGYNTWNFYVYYGLGKLFKDDIITTGGEVLEMRALKVGIIFYAL